MAEQLLCARQGAPLKQTDTQHPKTEFPSAYNSNDTW